MKRYLLFAAVFFTLCATAQDAVQEKVYRTTEVDAKPDLKNGMYTLRMFVSQNYKFPEQVKNKKITIFTSFVIEPDGLMKDEKAFYISVKDYMPTDIVAIQTEEQKAEESKIYASMKEEAARVLLLFNETWIPAQIAGKPVRCLYNYPISFNIE